MSKASAPLGRVSGFFYEFNLEAGRIGGKPLHTLWVDSHWLRARRPGPVRKLTVCVSRDELVELRNQIDHHLSLHKE